MNKKETEKGSSVLGRLAQLPASLWSHGKSRVALIRDWFNKTPKPTVALELAIPVLSFFLPILLMVIMLSILGFYPFVDKGHTLISFDAQSEYVAYYRYLKATLEGNRSLVYSMEYTLGGSFLALMGFYLNSPLGILVLGFSYADIPNFFLLITLMKMGFAGLFMYALIRHDWKKASFSSLAFSVGYGICSYSVVYLSNIMWLDGVSVLPLVVLGIQCLFEDRRLWLYPLALGLILYTSWYIGFMTCVFAVIFFLSKWIPWLLQKGSKRPKHPLRPMVHFGALSLIGGALAAVCWVMAVTHFGGTKAGGWNFNHSLIWLPFSDLIDGFLTNHYTGGMNIAKNQGYLAAFTSLVALYFAILYFFEKGHSRGDRIAQAAVFAFYALAVLFVPLDTLMHGGAQPTWFPARYSFVICFLAVYWAYQGYGELNSVSWVGLSMPWVLMAICLPIAMLTKNGSGETYELSVGGLVIFLLTGLTVTGYWLVLRFKPKWSRAAALALGIVLVPLSAASAYLGEAHVFSSGKGEYQYIQYYQDDQKYQIDFDRLKAEDPYYDYRMENTWRRKGSYNGVDNDAMFYGFQGLSHYSSTESKAVMAFMGKLGFHYDGFNASYAGGSTLAVNSALGIKYLMDNQTRFYSFYGNLDRMDDLTAQSTNGIVYYQNPFALPLAMVTAKNPSAYVPETAALSDGTTHALDPFEYQNAFFAALTRDVVDSEGNPKPIFTQLEGKLEAFEDTTRISETDGRTYVTTQGKANFYYAISPDASGKTLYLDFEKPVKDSQIAYDLMDYDYSTTSKVSINAVGTADGQPHGVRIQLQKAVTNQMLSPLIYQEDTAVLWEYVDAIKANAVSRLSTFQTPFSFGFKGSVNLARQKDQELLFTLPYEKNLRIFIDGKPVSTAKRMTVFTGADLSGVSAGEHEIAVEYTDKGFEAGVFVTILGLISLLGYESFWWMKSHEEELMGLANAKASKRKTQQKADRAVK